MTAVVASCDGTNDSDVVTAVDSLGINSNDLLVTYTIGSKVFFVKYPL